MSAEPAAAAKQPVRRELRLLVGALVVFLLALIAAMFALAFSVMRIDSVAPRVDSLAADIKSSAETASPAQLQSRLESLLGTAGLRRVEVFRGRELVAAAGDELQETEVITRPTRNGRIVFHFEPAAHLGGRRAALIGAGLVTMAAVAGLLILIVYVPKFLQPVNQLLAEADRLADGRAVDDDARYLVQTFRDAVERVQRQASEIEQLRSTAVGRTTNLAEIIRSLDRNFRSGFIAIESSGAILSINDSARHILHLDRPDAKLPAHVDELGATEFESLIRDSFRSRSAVNRHEARGEGDTVVGCTTVPLFDDADFLGMLVLFVDVTASRAMESRLREVENLVALGQMSAGIAHEFRNSLSTILGYLKLAGRDAPDDVAAKIRGAEAEGRQLAAAVDSLLSFTKPLQIRFQPLRLDEVAASVVDRVAALHADVRMGGNRQAAEISGDRDLLERAIENIVRNAIDAVRERHPEGGGVIDVNTTSSPHPCVEVRDNGVGVDPEQISSYLLPFQSGKTHGVGLGLPLARKIVLHHGGTLTLEGARGEGTVVRMEFFTPPMG